MVIQVFYEIEFVCEFWICVWIWYIVVGWQVNIVQFDVFDIDGVDVCMIFVIQWWYVEDFDWCFIGNCDVVMIVVLFVNGKMW